MRRAIAIVGLSAGQRLGRGHDRACACSGSRGERQSSPGSLVERLPLTVYLDRLENGGSSSVYTSPRLEAALRRTIDESASADERFLDLMHPDDRERVITERRRTRERGEPFRMEYRMIAHDGTARSFLDEA